jgi:2-oxoglutarate dehydrogenase E1 component
VRLRDVRLREKRSGPVSQGANRIPEDARKGQSADAASEADAQETVSAPDSAYYADFGINAGVVEEIHDRFQVDPRSVDASWGGAFDRAPAAPPAASAPQPLTPSPSPSPTPTPTPTPGAAPAPPAPVAPVPSPQPMTQPPAAPAGAADPVVNLQLADKYARVLRLIHFFRARGHRIANSDPLGGQSTYFPELDPAHYGFGHEDMDAKFITGDLPGGSVQSLGEILTRLKATYCGSIGAEFTHVQDPGRKAWLREIMEESLNQPRCEPAEQIQILEQISKAELFERFLHTKFLGQKRFSLEGAECAIPMLDAVVESAPRFGVREIVIGMSHRGRLNVLANVLGKSYEAIFSEFADNPLILSPFGSGDVKYHKGYSTDRFVQTGERVHLTLTSNPSHLEVVNPVVVGRAKAKQVRANDTEGETILPVLLHGDAAFAGQGIVAETLNLSQLRGYSTGGTIHFIINNQIGFTTTPSEARSTLYCSDVAKMIQVPIFHVNGDDPEAVVHCVKLAMAYRQRFGDDVVIDFVCYRRHGHNEGDEPAFTQPRLYQKIRKRPSVRTLYTEHLVETGVLDAEAAAAQGAVISARLQEAHEATEARPPGPDEPYEPNGPWTGYSRFRPEHEIDTGVPIERLAKIAEGLGALPAYFHAHPKLNSVLERRSKTVAEGAPIDWGMGEALAFGSLLLEGTPVRLSGQDSSRGTFSHRHAVFVDQESGEEYAPLDHLSGTQARFEVYDSLLSEAAVLGFEYGYSLADPSTLTMWEAQFGDFVNGAQVIIDQFITSAHVKWSRMSGLVMLLPHGYEGQGPEHSSARIERFLQTCAEDCLQVVNCTTPAQYFHVLRRQMRRNYLTPMVIFTPKSLLRSPVAASRVEEISEGTRFQTVIDDPIAAADPGRVERVLLSFGKVHYDIIEERRERLGDEAGRVAVVRVEELYPWPEDRLKEIFEQYASARRVVWVQEEPANMGGWTFVEARLLRLLSGGAELAYAGREPAASPATGSMRIHKAEQAALLDDALDGY